jgi:transcriptional regulator with XRE-family HTH domain
MSRRREQAAFSDRLRAEGCSWAQVADALRSRYHVNARVALRLARGWSQTRAAAEWTTRWPDDEKTAKNFSYWETWPRSGHAPSLRVLDRLAQLYECSPADLIADLPSYHRPATVSSGDAGPLPQSTGALPPPAADGAGLMASGPVPDLPLELDAFGPGGDGLAVPAHVAAADVAMVRSMTAILAAAENNLGGGAVGRANLRPLRWAAGLLGASAPRRIRGDLFEAVGNLAEVAGFSAFDAGDHTTALKCYRFALWCADEGESWPLRACTLADIARMHAELDDIDAALSAIEFAQVRMDRLPATARAMLSTMHARYHVLAGRHLEARRKVEAGDAWMTEADPRHNPPWLKYYDSAEHDGSVARAFLPLALATRDGATEVRRRLTSAVQHQSPDYPRSRAFSQTRLAQVVATTGDPNEAAYLGEAALDDADAITSRRLDDELRTLVRMLDARASAASVRQLRERVDAHLRRTEATLSAGAPP